MTRSFGDENLKSVVIVDPEIVVHPLTPHDELMMLSCDGIFDVMSYEEVAAFLDETMKSGVRIGQLASALVQEAVRLGGTDDITGTTLDIVILSNILLVALLVELKNSSTK